MLNVASLRFFHTVILVQEATSSQFVPYLGTGYKLIEDIIIPKIQNPPAQTKEGKPSPKTKRASSQPSDSEMKKVQPWLGKELKLDFDILKIGNSPTKWVLFIYHILINELQVAPTVSAGLAHAYAAKQFPTMPIERKRFTNTANNLKNSEKMGMSQSREYYLTEVGKEEAKKILSSS